MCDHVTRTAELVAAHADTLDVDLDDRDAWLAARGEGIGGSDAGAILGVSGYQTPFTLAMEKTGQIKPRDLSDNEAIYWGRKLEDIVAAEFGERLGVPVWAPGVMYRSKTNPFQLANPDRFTVDPADGEPAILEVKTAGFYAAKDWEIDGEETVPLHYEAQDLHYAAVTGIRRLFICALLAGQRFVWRRVDVDEETIQAITEAERYFWEHYVIGGETPPVDANSVTTDALSELWEPDDTTAVLGNNELVYAAQYLEARDAAKEADEAKQLAGNRLRASLESASRGTVDGVEIVAWPSTKDRVKTNWQSVAADLAVAAGNPDITDQVIARHTTTKPGPRTLRIPKKAEAFIKKEASNL